MKKRKLFVTICIVLSAAVALAASFSSYTRLTLPSLSDLILLTDVSDTTQSVNGSTKAMELRYLPISDPMQTALDGKQDDLPIPSDADLQAGTAADEIVLTAQKLLVAINAHAMSKDRMRLPLTTAEPTDEEIGDIFRFDNDLYDPNNVPGNTPYDAICVTAGSPGTYVNLHDVGGRALHEELAAKAVVVTAASGINLTSEHCGKIIFMTGPGEVGLPDCSLDLVGCFVRVDTDENGHAIELAMFGDTTIDRFVLEDGTLLPINYEADLPDFANNRINAMCKKENHWYLEEIKGVATNGGPAD